MATEFEMESRSGSMIDMLKEDHRKVKDLFREFEDAEDRFAKEEVVRNVILELKIHSSIEEEIFYPAAREVVQDEELMDEAEEEHHVVKLLIAELEELDVDDEHFAPKFKVLAENVKHHIQEEEEQILPKVEASAINRQSDLLEEVMQRKQELLEELENASSGMKETEKTSSHRKNKSAARKAKSKARRH